MTDELKENLKNSQGRQIFKDYLSENFENADALLEKFDLLTSLYFEVNAVINISALKTVDDVYIKHYLDSLYPYKHFSGTCCDVGCGGGFPCLPLALATDLHITGVESVGKKLLLIRRAVSEIHIENLKADYARSEDLVKLHRSYDTTTARALADTDKSLSFCAPLTKTGGKIILYKTQNDSEAKQQTREKNFVVLNDTVDYVLPGTDIKRRLFIYSKN